MKPITGSVVSSKPISLSKAATLMSRFAASDAGAHPDVSAFLRRTSEAFDEFARFQKELRGRGQAHGSKDGEQVERKKEKKKKKEEPAVIKADQDGNFIGMESCRKKKEERVVETVQARSLAVTEVRSKRKEGDVVKAAQDGSFAESESKMKKKKEKKEEAGSETAQDPEESKSGGKGNKTAAKEIEGRLGNVVEVKTEKSNKHQVKKYEVVDEEREEDVENQSKRKKKKTEQKEEAGTEAAQDPEEIKSGSKENKRAAKDIEGRFGNVVEVKTEKSSKHQVKKYEVANEERKEDAANQSERQRKKNRKMEQDGKGDNGHVVRNHEERHHKKKRKIKEES